MSTIDAIRKDEPAASMFARRKRADYVHKLIVAVVSVSNWFERRLEKRRSRHALLELTDEQLKDIGISRCDAHREGIRSFWD